MEPNDKDFDNGSDHRDLNRRDIIVTSQNEGNSNCRFCRESRPHPRLARGETYPCGYKPYRCEVCGYSTTTKGNLTIHLQSDKHQNNLRVLTGTGENNYDQESSDCYGIPWDLYPDYSSLRFVHRLNSGIESIFDHLGHKKNDLNFVTET